MSDTGERYQLALAAEQAAWVALRNHFYDEMRMAYENGGDTSDRMEACRDADRMVEALQAATTEVALCEARLVAERRERQRWKPDPNTRTVLVNALRWEPKP